MTSVNQADRRVVGVTTTKTTFHAPRVVNCAGAWSSQIQPHAFPTRPVKGQMLMPCRAPDVVETRDPHA